MKKLLSVNRWLNHHELLLILLLLTTLLRFPTLYEPFWYGDENIYLAIGQGVRSGFTLYTDITDFPNKPPAIYLLAAWLSHVSPFRFFLLIWSLFHVATTFFIIRRLTPNPISRLGFSLLFILLTQTPIFEGTIANAEIFFILPTSLALLSLLQLNQKHPAITHQPSRHFLAGLSLGFAFLFKIHVILDIAAFGIFLYLFPQKPNPKSIIKLIKSKSPWSFIAGLAIPVVLTLITLSLFGISPFFLAQNAASSGGYVSFWQQQDWITQLLTFGSLYARSLALLIFTLLLYLFQKRFKPIFLFLALWTGFALFAALLSTRPYPHYLIQVIPPAIFTLSYLYSHPKKTHLFLSATLAAIVIAAYLRFDFATYPVFPYYHNFTQYISGQINQTQYYRSFDQRMPRNYALAQAIQSRTQPKDKIYIWGTEPEVYVLSARNPSGSLVVSFHVPDLDYYQATIDAINQDQTPLIVWMESEHRPFPKLRQLLNTQYTQIATIGDPDQPLGQQLGHRALIFRRLP